MLILSTMPLVVEDSQGLQTRKHTVHSAAIYIHSFTRVTRTSVYLPPVVTLGPTFVFRWLSSREPMGSSKAGVIPNSSSIPRSQPSVRHIRASQWMLAELQDVLVTAEWQQCKSTPPPLVLDPQDGLSFVSLGLGLHVTWLGRQISKERARSSAKFLSHTLPTSKRLAR